MADGLQLRQPQLDLQSRLINIARIQLLRMEELHVQSLRAGQTPEPLALKLKAKSLAAQMDQPLLQVAQVADRLRDY